MVCVRVCRVRQKNEKCVIRVTCSRRSIELDCAACMVFEFGLLLAICMRATQDGRDSGGREEGSGRGCACLWARGLRPGISSPAGVPRRTCWCWMPPLKRFKFLTTLRSAVSSCVIRSATLTASSSLQNKTSRGLLISRFLYLWGLIDIMSEIDRDELPKSLYASEANRIS
jgi:hypothetical protein